MRVRQQCHFAGDPGSFESVSIVFYNMTLLSQLWAHKEATQDMMHIAQISPVAWQHINFYGRYEFTKASDPINYGRDRRSLGTSPPHSDCGRRRWLIEGQVHRFGGICKNPLCAGDCVQKQQKSVSSSLQSFVL